MNSPHEPFDWCNNVPRSAWLLLAMTFGAWMVVWGVLFSIGSFLVWVLR